MKLKLIYGLLFLFLLIFPLQGFAHEEDHDHHDPDHPPWLTDQGDDHDHDHDYEETGTNWPLLSTFAVINGGFILFGAVRKYKRTISKNQA